MKTNRQTHFPFFLSETAHTGRYSILLTALTIAMLFVILGWSGMETATAQEIPTDVSADEVNLVARELWCPLCSGVRLDSCELKACDQMKDVIALKLSEGESTENIQAYFVEQYGPQVLGEPPREGFNWLAWILPAVAVVGGGVFVWNRARHMVRPDQAENETSGPQQKSEDEPAEDTYERRLEEELAQYK